MEDLLSELGERKREAERLPECLGMISELREELSRREETLEAKDELMGQEMNKMNSLIAEQARLIQDNEDLVSRV